MIRCTNCSHQNPEGQRYCQRCGINLGDALPKSLVRPTQRPTRLAGWRYDLLANVRGRVLELGVRAGPNLRFYPPEVKVVLTDISIENLHDAITVFPRFKQGVAFSLADAQRLPFASASFDTVVSTLLFCSIPDPLLALGEITRVLKPGGYLYTIDHVRSDVPLIGVIQDAIAPVWTALSGGCHVNRRTEDTLHSAGFTIQDERRAVLGIMRWMVTRPPE